MRTLEELTALHLARRDADPEHDRSDCVCCCTDCEDIEAEVALAVGPPNGLPVRVARALPADLALLTGLGPGEIGYLTRVDSVPCVTRGPGELACPITVAGGELAGGALVPLAAGEVPPIVVAASLAVAAEAARWWG